MSEITTVIVPTLILYYGVFVHLSLVVYCIFLTLYIFTRKEAAILNLPNTSSYANENLTKDIASKEILSSENIREVLASEKSLALNSMEKPSQNKIEKNSKLLYRIEEEGKKSTSTEFTRRGMLWSRHASWHLPLAPPRIPSRIEEGGQGLEQVIDILKRFDVDPVRGFLPSHDPLQRLPYARYHIWEDLGDDLSKLLGARLGQARDPLRQLPVLKTDKLMTDSELRRAHLLLSLFAHAYVWGGPSPEDHIPEGIARPLWEVSERLGLPPVLGHPSIIIYNWRRLDTEAEISMENLATLNNFFDGRDESWFYLVTVEIEARGAAAIVPLLLATDAIQRYDEEEAENKLSDNDTELMNSREMPISKMRCESREDASPAADAPLMRTGSRNHSIGAGRNNSTGTCQSPEYRHRLWTYAEDDDDESATDRALIGELTPPRVAAYVAAQLAKVAEAIKGMCISIETMREGCHPFIFYHRVRPFLSGWKDNPVLPTGVIYKGISEEPRQFFGGSAAQSALLPLLDIGLGISHANTKSHQFLFAMREYMSKPHRQFLEYFETISCIRRFILICLPSDRIMDTTSGLISRKVPSGTSTGTSEPSSVYNDPDKLFSPKDVQMLPVEPVSLLDDDSWIELCEAYNTCVANLQRFRSSHINLVADYIIAQQMHGTKGNSLEGSAGGKGTGGTELMKFLKPIRDNCKNSLIEGDHEEVAGTIATNTLNQLSSTAISINPIELYPTSSSTSIHHTVTASAPLLRTLSRTQSQVVASKLPPVSTALIESKLELSFKSSDPPYVKDNAGFDDIDLYRGGTSPHQDWN